MNNQNSKKIKSHTHPLLPPNGGDETRREKSNCPNFATHHLVNKMVPRKAILEAIAAVAENLYGQRENERSASQRDDARPVDPQSSADSFSHSSQKVAESVITREIIEAFRLYELPVHCLFGESHRVLRRRAQVGSQQIELEWITRSVSEEPHVQGTAYKFHLLDFRPHLLPLTEKKDAVFEIVGWQSGAARAAGIHGEQWVLFHLAAIKAALFAETEVRWRIVPSPDESEAEKSRRSPIAVNYHSRTIKLFSQKPVANELDNNRKRKPRKSDSSGSCASDTTSVWVNRDYLNILAAAPPIDFSAKQLSSFHPLELRLFELVNYRQKKRRAARSKRLTFEISYDELRELVPFPTCDSFAQMQELLEDIFITSSVSGWVRQCRVEPPRTSDHLDTKIIFEFGAL
jgi:hypothetical protein